MKNYFVSVLITNYNKGKFLKNSITSVLNQTYKNKEVLLFDDCSKDDSLKILSKYRNIKIIRNKNKKYKRYLNDSLLTSIAGISAAMKNTG